LKVAVGLIWSHGFPVQTAFVKGVFDWYGALVTGQGNTPDCTITDVRLIYSEDFPVDAARNDIVRTFLNDAPDYEYLVFLDADMRHPAHTIHRLVGHRLPVVTGRYQMRKAPFQTVAMRRTGDGPHAYKAIEEQRGMVKIDAAGAGVLAIRRDVLEAIREKHGENWFQYQMGPNGLRSVSEDMWFFERAAEAGYPAFCDLDLVCSHVTHFEVGPQWHAPFRDAYNEAMAVKA
jgi:hypothetical protein